MFRTLEKNLLKHPTKTALVYFGREISNRELHGYICKFAIALQKSGVGKGRVVTIALPNIPEAVIALYAVDKIGGVASFVHPKTPATKTLALMEKSNSTFAILLDTAYIKEKAIFDAPEHDYIFASVANFMKGGAKTLYSAKNHVKKSSLGGDCFISDKLIFSELKILLEGRNNQITREKQSGETPDKDRICLLLHSSGTTDTPKTVPLSEGNVNYVAKNSIDLLGNASFDGKSVLTVLPLFHGFGLVMSLHTPLLAGISCVLVPEFTEKIVVSAIKKSNVAFLCGVPKMYQKLASFPTFKSCGKLKNIQLAFCGGEEMTPATMSAFENLMKSASSPCQILQGYGMTECVSCCCCNTQAENKPQSCGKPIAGTRIKILNENGETMPRGELGEIAIKSPALAKGYLLEDPRKEDYLKTGDIGYIDEAGFLFFKERKNSVIVISGYKVYPSEIVTVAKKSPYVSDCTVIKATDKHGNFAHLVVLLCPGIGKETATKEISALLKSNLESFAVPKQISFIDGELPRTATGKIDKTATSKLLS